MTLLKGTLRAISAAAWTADVQVAGSLGSYLTGVPLSVAIPEGELVAGRTVIVAVPDERNPGDVSVLAVISAPLTSRGQTFNDLFVDADLDVDGYIQHNALTASQLVKTDASKRLVSSATVSLTSEVTGIVPIANGGTALSTAPSNGQVLIGNGTGYTLATLTGTANRVTVTNGAGTITLSGPQDLHSGASPSFASVTATGGINVGTGSGAAAGEIMASGRIAANMETLLNTDRPKASLGSGATANVTIANHAIVIVTVGNAANSPYFNTSLWLIGWDAVNGTMNLVSQSAGSGTAVSVYDSGATGVVVTKVATGILRIVNNFGYAVDVRVFSLGN